MKPLTYQSPENELEDVDLGILGLCSWEAKYFFNEGIVNVVSAYAHYRPDDETDQLIDITRVVQQDFECKEWISNSYHREREADLDSDADRFYEQWRDRKAEESA